MVKKTSKSKEDLEHSSEDFKRQIEQQELNHADKFKKKDEEIYKMNMANEVKLSNNSLIYLKKLVYKTLEKSTLNLKKLKDTHRKDQDIIMNLQQKLQISEQNLEEVKRVQAIENLNYKGDLDKKLNLFTKK